MKSNKPQYRVKPFDLVKDVWYLEKRVFWVLWVNMGVGKEEVVRSKLDKLLNPCSTEESISQEQAQEYREVAGLVCLSLDLLSDMAEDDMFNLDRLRREILLARKDKEEIIHDPKMRKTKWEACNFLFSIPVSKSK